MALFEPYSFSNEKAATTILAIKILYCYIEFDCIQHLEL